MQITIALFAATAFAGLIVKRDSASIVADLKDVKAKSEALVTALDAYGGGLLAALPIQNAASPLEAALTKTAKDVAAEPPTTSDADAQKVLDAVKELEPGIKRSTDLVVTKAASFGAVKGTVSGEMTRFKTISDSISDGLLSRVPASLKPEAEKLKATVDGYFGNAVKALS